MEKILFVTDAQQLSNKAMDFAGFICQLSKSKLTGIFLENSAAGGFKKACDARSIVGALHPDTAITSADVVAESRFADLVLLQPDGIALHGAACPVVVMPSHFEGLDQLVFIYDGEAASINAIKQFTYLFPDLKDLPVNVVCLTEHEEELGKWFTSHYRDVAFTHHTLPELREYLGCKERAFIVVNNELPSQRMSSQALFVCNN